ncbi:hypothetical protein EC970259_B0073 [Escherichia coli 99.0741]|nr:hypothetical protein EC12264_A0058 [Escherichia coli 1.2264]EIH44690.1 hypothetical protein EC970259_B0073 [Escherichia coli 99.0741]
MFRVNRQRKREVWPLFCRFIQIKIQQKACILFFPLNSNN